jgi:mono/diheme cytochrome c family protein
MKAIWRRDALVSTALVSTTLASMTLVVACGGTNDALHGRVRASSSDFALARGAEPVSREQLGMIRLMFDDLGGLRIANDRGSALPWKLLVAAIVIDRSSRRGTPATMEEARAAFSEVGFLFADSIANSPQSQPARHANHPIGIVTGTADYRFPRLRLEIANITCGACHVGVMYDSTGSKTHAAWAGMPNTSIDVGAFSKAVYRGLKLSYSKELVLATIDSLFPDIDPRERHTIEKYVLPTVERRVKEMAAGIDAPIPFNTGGPGQANSIAAMRYQLGIMSSDTMSHTAAYSSIPDFANRQMRNVLLYDGGYVIPGQRRDARISLDDVTDDHLLGLARIASVFSVAVMGVRLEEAPRNIGALDDVMHFIRAYRPPPFPGHIDGPRADEGERIYASRCAACHGTMSHDDERPRLLSLPNRLVPVSVIGTDGRRAAEADSSIAATLRAGYGHIATIDSTGAYIAPPLTGIWATAPYLHNGSVPTLWHLMHPDQRPARFYVGGHSLDLAHVGIAGDVDDDGTMRYPRGYRPWSTPMLFDTSEPGRDNRGHESMFAGLSEPDKRALLEYLKRL